jgi:hypothetical protein
MKDLTDMNHPEELLAETELTNRRIEELKDYRKTMIERVNSSRGLTRLLHNFNFILSEKQIVRHIRFLQIQRDRIEVHYERMFGGEMPGPAEARPGQTSGDSTDSTRR